VSATNGTIEFVPGTHFDKQFEQVASDVIELSKKDLSSRHALVVRANIPDGTMVVFDVRIFHRGLANGSVKDRPVLYFTFTRRWFLKPEANQHLSINPSKHKAVGPQPSASTSNWNLFARLAVYVRVVRAPFLHHQI
jgi:ectoine hydroxylase-related dioxygenase (phytanoyl-CoA dioxygenase family)